MKIMKVATIRLHYPKQETINRTNTTKRVTYIRQPKFLLRTPSLLTPSQLSVRHNKFPLLLICPPTPTPHNTSPTNLATKSGAPRYARETIGTRSRPASGSSFRGGTRSRSRLKFKFKPELRFVGRMSVVWACLHRYMQGVGPGDVTVQGSGASGSGRGWRCRDGYFGWSLFGEIGVVGCVVVSVVGVQFFFFALGGGGC